jgi:hypothetical protein
MNELKDLEKNRDASTTEGKQEQKPSLSPRENLSAELSPSYRRWRLAELISKVIFRHWDSRLAVLLILQNPFLASISEVAYPTPLELPVTIATFCLSPSFVPLSNT